MKTLKFYLFLTVCALIFTQPLMAVTHVTTTTDGTSLVKKSKSIQESSKELKKQFKQEKKVAKLTKFFSKLGIDFNDPPTLLKWGIICLIIGAVTYALGWFLFGPLWYIGYLFWLAGCVLLILWLVKTLA